MTTEVTHIAVPAPPPIENTNAPPKSARKRPLKKWILAVVILIALAGAGVYLYLANLPKTEYVTAQIDRGDIDSTVTTTGNLNAVITVQVGSQVSGNIKALYADFNTKVKKGQLVALIDPAPFQAPSTKPKLRLIPPRPRCRRRKRPWRNLNQISQARWPTSPARRPMS